MALLPFPDSEEPLMWVNPEHISALVPAISRGPAPVSLHVRFKVLGLSELNLNLGSFDSHEGAEARWRELLAMLGNAVVPTAGD